ncbi:MAG: hypothetical protein RL367_1641 [Pseudomonadota bacterium]
MPVERPIPLQATGFKCQVAATLTLAELPGEREFIEKR